MGPLVVGTVYTENSDALVEMGVKDSKKLSPKRREILYEQITTTVEHWGFFVTTAAEIDDKMKRMSLNDIELEMFVQAAKRWPNDTVIVDCPEVNELSFQSRLHALIGTDAQVIAKNKADDTYPVVSAASIVAKVNRDRLMNEISEEFGVNLGSGYPSDHITMDFVRDWIQKNGTPPPEVRTSWEPVKKMLSVKKNTKIDEW